MKGTILSMPVQFFFVASRGPHKAFTSSLVGPYSCTKEHVSVLTIKLLHNMSEKNIHMFLKVNGKVRQTISQNLHLYFV